ncbi:hypothetical protein M885DRAFT_88929 [Pelagophyceae sp. CCMP2097]|nr:hypothetical protein M885DRAFT_88929 [Pelagophyceae sp. CCMP2097]
MRQRVDLAQKSRGQAGQSSRSGVRVMAAMETLASLARSELPEALQELNQKHVYINDVIQWCETSYQTGNKKAQTKEYLVDSLESVAKEVENVADKLSDFLTLQGNALDDLGTMLELINEKLDVAKAQNAAVRFFSLLRMAARRPRGSHPKTRFLGPPRQVPAGRGRSRAARGGGARAHGRRA